MNLREMPLIAMRGLVLFPNTVAHFDIGREKSLLSLDEAMNADKKIFLTSQIDSSVELPTFDDLNRTGCICVVEQLVKRPGDLARVLVKVLSRAVIVEEVQFEPYFKVKVEPLEISEKINVKACEALKRSILSSFIMYSDIVDVVDNEFIMNATDEEDYGKFADVIISVMHVSDKEKYKILDEFNVLKRLQKLHKLLINELLILETERKINEKVRVQMNKFQREYYLKEQIKAIENELGEKETVSEEAAEYEKKLKTLKVSKDIKEKVMKEIDRYSRIQSSQPESSVIKSYLDTIFDLPWNKRTKDKLDITYAKEVLDSHHYGLDKVKERILEFLAVRQLTKNSKSPIICLVGPSGTGKTSIARSIALSLNRKFVHMSLGGVRDEAEIRGHRRTYVGAIPGRIITLLRECKVKNPVFLFDEIDKMDSEFNGDPASAMLEVLDPEQNKEFTDHYLELPFDLSEVLFLTTANSTSTIPGPLYDRMEIIDVSGYTEYEKLNIAEKFLIPKVTKENGLKETFLKFSDGTLSKIINNYTSESGVRGLERTLGKICRKAAIKKIQNPKLKFLRITLSNLVTYLGKEKYTDDLLGKENEVGCVNGMAWTEVGGVTLLVEASMIDGEGKLVLTGQLGDVMKESAKAGLTYIRKIAPEHKIRKDVFSKKDIHVHLPEGAVPKDGPSAGITMATAIYSAITGVPVRSDVAMTGEITLRGKVLPVGGIKEKLLAAYRAGIREIIMPKENERDSDEIPASVMQNIKIHYVGGMDEVLKYALAQKEDK